MAATSRATRCERSPRLDRHFVVQAPGLSKKLDNLSAAVDLHAAHYNFCHRLRENGKSGRYRPTPAIMAGIVPDLWDWERLYDEVTGLAAKDDAALKTERLLKAMMRQR